MSPFIRMENGTVASHPCNGLRVSVVKISVVQSPCRRIRQEKEEMLPKGLENIKPLCSLGELSGDLDYRREGLSQGDL